MRNRAIFFGLVLAVFGGINYYIGLRGWQWLGAAAPGLVAGWVYGLLFAVISSAFFVARFAGEFLPRAVADGMARAGIQVLVDRWVKVDDSLYLIGRDDISGRQFGGRPRRDLAGLLEGVDRSLPLVLMDHQPYRLEEAEQAGIDLQVSGHTHRGQLFPNHLITRRVFELDWGYLKKGALHVIVSLGFGTWGPPVRIGNRPEVVSIKVRFTGSQA